MPCSPCSRSIADELCCAGVSGVRLAEDGTPRMVISQVGANGVINHSDPAHPQPEVFGPTRQAVDLLDGCLLACRRSTLLQHQLRFDQRFRFH